MLDNDSDGFPWVIGQVCRRWRAAFLSHPPLWTILSLRDGDFSPASLAEMERRTAIYLKRSGQLPLTILVTVKLLWSDKSEKISYHDLETAIIMLEPMEKGKFGCASD